MINEFVVKKGTIKRLKGLGKFIQCRKCGKREFKIGTKIISKNTSDGTSYKLYHKKCYEEMFI